VPHFILSDKKGTVVQLTFTSDGSRCCTYGLNWRLSIACVYEIRQPNESETGHLLTAKKNGVNIMQALLDAIQGKPFMPLVGKIPTF